MKKIVLMFGFIMTVTACAAEPIPVNIQQKVDVIPVEQLQQNSMAERDLCGGTRDEERTACRIKVRRDSLAREMMREEGNPK